MGLRCPGNLRPNGDKLEGHLMMQTPESGVEINAVEVGKLFQDSIPLASFFDARGAV
jgi:hypothetical protein